MKTEEIKKILKNKKSILIACVVFLLILFVLIDYIFLVQRSYKVPAPTTENVSEIPQKPQDPTVPKEDATTYDTLYNDGILLFKKNDMNGAIEKFNQAIELNPSNVDYYKLKSAAENSLGRKEDAINTVRAGLKISPSDQLLINRLDSLQKDSYNSQTNDGRN